jgi:hypothetical protein
MTFIGKDAEHTDEYRAQTSFTLDHSFRIGDFTNRLENRTSACESECMTTTVAEGNTVAIPNDLAAELGIKPGTQLDWQRPSDSPGTLVLKVVLDRAALIESVFGAGRKYLKPGEDPISDLIKERALEEIMAPEGL